MFRDQLTYVQLVTVFSTTCALNICKAVPCLDEITPEDRDVALNELLALHDDCLKTVKSLRKQILRLRLRANLLHAQRWLSPLSKAENALDELERSLQQGDAMLQDVRVKYDVSVN